MLRKPVVLLTGASGEIGHGLIERLAKDGQRAIITLDLRPLEPDIARLVQYQYAGSILDLALLERILAEFEVDLIFHLAALLSTRGEFTPTAAHSVNVEGTLRLLEFAQREGESHGRPVTFLYPSSSSVRVANVERLPEAQYATIVLARSGTACSIRDSSHPRGRWRAPGMCPSSHSSRSRTSRKTAGSASSCNSRARSASISSICCRVSWRKSRYELIAFHFIATGLRLWSRREPADAHVFAGRTCRRGRRRPRCRHGGFHAN